MRQLLVRRSLVELLVVIAIIGILIALLLPAVQGIDHLLGALACESVVGGGWAVWRHGYVARVTEAIDIGLPADRIDAFMRVASFSGFEILPQPPGRWPKLLHRETGIQIDVLPEGARPGTPARMAPTTIRHPKEMGAAGHQLQYIDLPSLVELKLAAGRSKDESDVVELLKVNLKQVDAIRRHLQNVNPDYVTAFDRQLVRAQEDQER